jgi:plastocyanin
MKRTRRILMSGLAVALAAAVTACGGDQTATEGRAGAAPAVEPTGTVHEVLMVSGRGEIFEPAHIDVARGDVVRFILEMGVHNASFPPDRNPAGVTLPEATPYLQIPGQAHDMLIDLPEGEYYFHCDPHAALGMTGTMSVK